jgi:hypothetical protein
VRRALGSCEDLVCYRQNTGLLEREGRPVRAGLCVGSSDLIGLLAPVGRFVALEVKTRTGRVSPEQVRFLELVRKMGGFACVVRSADEALRAIERARKGESE